MSWTDRRALRIDELVHAGDIEGAIEETSALTEQLAEDELARALDELALPEDDLEAGFATLRELIGAENGGLRIVSRGDDFIEMAAEDDPLAEGTYVDLPGEVVMEERDSILADLVSRVRPAHARGDARARRPALLPQEVVGPTHRAAPGRPVRIRTGSLSR